MSEGAEIDEYLRRIIARRSDHPKKTITGILGSSRNDGNTRSLTDAVFCHFNGARLIDLSDFTMAPYDYGHAYARGEFLPVAELMSQSQAIIFASPVYWYSMSGQMKVFFDRLTDLTETRKSLGRSLAGKTAYVIATSRGKIAPPSFEPPFAKTAGYFGMQWGGMLHGTFGKDRQLSPELNAGAAAFAKRIKMSLQEVGVMSASGALAA